MHLEPKPKQGQGFCSDCRTCPAGQHVDVVPSTISDRVCALCPSHSFSNSSNQEECTECPPHEVQPKPNQVCCLPAIPSQFVIKHNSRWVPLEAKLSRLAILLPRSCLARTYNSMFVLFLQSIHTSYRTLGTCPYINFRVTGNNKRVPSEAVCGNGLFHFKDGYYHDG